MDDRQQKIQLQLAFMTGGKAESPTPVVGGTESITAESKAESPAQADGLMEEILRPENLKEALKRVKANKGSAGVDRMTVDLLPVYLQKHWPEIREQLLRGAYSTASGNTETRWRRGQEAGNSRCRRQISSAGGDAGSATHMGPDLLGTQLWISPEALGSSGGSKGAGICG